MKRNRIINLFIFSLTLACFMVNCKPSNLIYDPDGTVIHQTDSTYFILFKEINGNGGRYIQFKKD